MKLYYKEWEKYTSDPTILEIVDGYKLKFVNNCPPFQEYRPRPYKLKLDEIPEINKEIQKLFKRGVIEPTLPEYGDFVSNIFTRPKKDGTLRMILDLSRLNDFIQYHHFKMDTFDVAAKLVTRNCYMASLDLKDAYYSISIDSESRKYLKFIWNGKMWQFKVLCNGLSSGPRIFTKLLKPPYAMLRSVGIQIVGYIDDSLLLAKSETEAKQAVLQTAQLLSSLGFVVHPSKSVVVPCREIQFLGLVINSEKMTITLPLSKKNDIIQLCERLLRRKKDTIRKVAELIGKFVAAFPAVQYGLLHYRELEKQKTLALAINRGNFDKIMRVNENARNDIRWWLHNVKEASMPIERQKPSICIQSDASGLGWGATDGNTHIGGRWNSTEMVKARNNEINYLELLAAFFGLKSFCSNTTQVHIHLQLDNTTAVAYVNKMGGTKSHECNELAKQMWQWCVDRDIWLTATHLPGVENVIADKKSRVFQDHTEWMLNKAAFDKLCEFYGIPQIDLFASRLNAQLPVYVSWKPDPGAVAIDAFTQDWSKFFFYAFPPFCLITACLQKIEIENAEGVMVVPKWPTQPWFPKLMNMLIEEPILLPRSKSLLIQPGSTEHHPLNNTLYLMFCRVSGSRSRVGEFQKTLRILSCHHGGTQLNISMQHILDSGNNFVTSNRLISCRQIYLKF